jgi:hypothetical protein
MLITSRMITGCRKKDAKYGKEGEEKKRETVEFFLVLKARLRRALDAGVVTPVLMLLLLWLCAKGGLLFLWFIIGGCLNGRYGIAQVSLSTILGVETGAKVCCQVD